MGGMEGNLTRMGENVCLIETRERRDVCSAGASIGWGRGPVTHPVAPLKTTKLLPPPPTTEHFLLFSL